MMQLEDKLHFAPCCSGDVIAAVPLIYSTGPDAFDYVFKNEKQTAQEFLTFAFQRKAGEFSYQNHIGLFHDSNLIGIGARFSREEAAKFLFFDAKNIMSFYKLKSPSTLMRGLKIEAMIKPPVGQEIALAHIAINPEFRGKGLGSKMMLHLQNISKKDQEYYVLDVSLQNPRAQVLYERLGYTIAKTYKSKLKNKFSTVPDHHRMELR